MIVGVKITPDVSHELTNDFTVKEEMFFCATFVIIISAD